MRETILFCFALFACSFELIAAHCQEKPQSWTDGTAKQRLKDIFEKGEFGVPRFTGRWWTDSSGFSIQQRNPKTNKLVSVHFDARTGKRTDAPPLNKSETRRDWFLPTVNRDWNFETEIFLWLTSQVAKVLN